MIRLHTLVHDDTDARTRGALAPYYERLSLHPPVARTLELQGLEP